MDKKRFHLIIQKYIAGNCSDEEKNLIDQWYELLDDESLPALDAEELDTIRLRTLRNVKNKPVKTPLPRRFSIPGYVKWMVAAGIGGIIIVSGYLWSRYQENTISEPYFSSSLNGFIEKVNSSSQPVNIVLEDSSLVILQPGAGIKYPTHFHPAKREIYMQGEAFFDVRKNPGQPFYVFNGNIITHVLGTSFNIKTNIENNTIQVDVHTGKVEVEENSEWVNKQKMQRVIVSPNQKVIYHASSGRFEASILEKPALIKKAEGDLTPVGLFVFDESPLSKVLKTLEEQYGIEVITDSEELLVEPFTGDISSGDLFAKLDIVCKSLKICYEVNGTQILIRNGNCN